MVKPLKSDLVDLNLGALPHGFLIVLSENQDVARLHDCREGRPIFVPAEVVVTVKGMKDKGFHYFITTLLPPETSSRCS